MLDRVEETMAERSRYGIIQLAFVSPLLTRSLARSGNTWKLPSLPPKEAFFYGNVAKHTHTHSASGSGSTPTRSGKISFVDLVNHELHHSHILLLQLAAVSLLVATSSLAKLESVIIVLCGLMLNQRRVGSKHHFTTYP